MSNSRTILPNRGDIVARTISGKKDVYFSLSDFVESDLPANTYEVLGVVAWRFHDEVLVVYKKNFSKKWCGRAWWNLSGFTLDGAEHTGVISIRVAGDSWAANVPKTITYTASDITSFVTQLNAVFTTDTDFVAQDWYSEANADGTTVRVHCNNVDYRQCGYNTASGGFTFVGGALPEVPILASMRRKNGGVGAYGACANYARYEYYFKTQAEATLTSQAPIRTTGYPTNFLTYKNSAYCSNLRAVYGGTMGDEDSCLVGWRKYLRSCKPVLLTDYGNHGIHDGKARGMQYGQYRFTSSTQTDQPMCNASEYCYNLPTYENLTTVEAGEFWLPTTQEMDLVIDEVEYGTGGTTGNEDILNSGLKKITSGHSFISNGTLWWMCCRYHGYSAWFVNGYFGYFDTYTLCFTYGVLPVSLFRLRA